MERYTVSMPLLPSALPPKGEASRYGANIFLKLIALPSRGMLYCGSFAASIYGAMSESGIQATSH